MPGGRLVHRPGTWILHRKELLLAPDDARRDAFAATTADYEARGLFAPENLRHIGHGPTWAKLLRKSKKNGMKEPAACYSEHTSIRQVPALHKALVSAGELKSWQVNADIGGGRFEDATAFLRSQKVTNLVYDCQLERAHNESVLRRLRDGADSATVANVLNVIPDPKVRDEVIQLTANVLRVGGVAWFAVYEGDRSGKARATTKGWQENRSIASYLREVSRVFPGARVVRVKGLRAIRAERRV